MKCGLTSVYFAETLQNIKNYVFIVLHRYIHINLQSTVVPIELHISSWYFLSLKFVSIITFGSLVVTLKYSTAITQ